MNNSEILIIIRYGSQINDQIKILSEEIEGNKCFIILNKQNLAAGNKQSHLSGPCICPPRISL